MGIHHLRIEYPKEEESRKEGKKESRPVKDTSSESALKSSEEVPSNPQTSDTPVTSSESPQKKPSAGTE